MDNSTSNGAFRIDNDRILFIERHGAVKMYRLSTKQLKTIATFNRQYNKRSAHEQFQKLKMDCSSLNKDPNFANH